MLILEHQHLKQRGQREDNYRSTNCSYTCNLKKVSWKQTARQRWVGAGCGDQSKVGKWLRRRGVPNDVRVYRMEYKSTVYYNSSFLVLLK